MLPEAVFGMPTYEYVVSWLRGRAKIRGVVSMPEALFKTSGKGCTHATVCVLFVENTKPKKDEDYEIFMAECQRGNLREQQAKCPCRGHLVVRDGTYLVGTSCILTEKDTKILYCGGLYKLRIEKQEKIDPYLLLALLNAPIVHRQMHSKQFTRDIIDTLGKRLFEVLLPIPKHAGLAARIAKKTRNVIYTRAQLRDRTKEIALEVEGRDAPSVDEIEALETL